LTSLKHDLVQKGAEVKTIYAQRDERVKAIADLECTVRSLEDDQEEAAKSRDQLVQDLANVEKEINAKEKELNDIIPDLSACKDKETKVKQRYSMTLI
jgi:chromosome segregation ATPase